jgi:hypothetical protein
MGGPNRQLTQYTHRRHAIFLLCFLRPNLWVLLSLFMNNTYEFSSFVYSLYVYGWDKLCKVKYQPKTCMKHILHDIFFFWGGGVDGLTPQLESTLVWIKYLPVYLIAVCSEMSPPQGAGPRIEPYNVGMIPIYYQQAGQVLPSSLRGSGGGRDGALLWYIDARWFKSADILVTSHPSFLTPTPRNDVRSLQISGWPEAAPQVQEAINIRCGQREKGRKRVLNDL